MSMKPLSYLSLAIATPLLLSACDTAHNDSPATEQLVFLSAFAPLCGQAFKGEVVTPDPGEEWENQDIIMHVRDCDEDEVRIPLHVGEDRSRTWVISATDSGLSLQHNHLHEDGSADELSPYGGHTTNSGSAKSQSFAVDAASVELFTEQGLTRSLQNVWTMAFHEGNQFSYSLTRAESTFEVRFDLDEPVAVPPAAWGYDAQ